MAVASKKQTPQKSCWKDRLHFFWVEIYWNVDFQGFLDAFSLVIITTSLASADDEIVNDT